MVANAEVIDIPVKCSFFTGNNLILKDQSLLLQKKCNKYSMNSVMDLNSKKDNITYNYLYNNKTRSGSNGYLYSWFGDFNNQIQYNGININYLKMTKSKYLIHYQTKEIRHTIRQTNFKTAYIYYLNDMASNILKKENIILNTIFIKKYNMKKYFLIIQNLTNMDMINYTTYSEISPEQMELFSQGNTLKIGDNYLIPANAPGLIDAIDKYVNQQAKLDEIEFDKGKAYTITDVSIMNDIFNKLTQ